MDVRDHVILGRDMQSPEAVPIVLFVFNRPDKTKRVLTALCKQTVCPQQLVVFADAPRDLADEVNVNEVRRLVRSIGWVDVHMIERPFNLGCAQNIIRGLAEVFQSHERACILEDDTLPAASWYEAMCLMLDRYVGEPAVFAVGGFPSVKSNALPKYPFDVMMSPRLSCWGWGTWADRWNGIVADLCHFRNPFGSSARVPTHAGFDLPGAAQAIENRPDFYWDVPLAVLCLHRGLLHALTRYYLVENIGVDGSGVHGSTPTEVVTFMKENNRIQDKVPLLFPPTSVRQDVCEAVQTYVRDISLATTSRRGRLSILNSVIAVYDVLTRRVRTAARRIVGPG